MVVLALVALAGVQWFRPIPSPVFRPALSTARLPGAPPSLLWPTTGSAAEIVEGLGSLGHVGNARPVPVAGLTKVMTAYVVLKDHPFASGSDGPAIEVTAAIAAAAQEAQATQESVVPVTAGETLTERQILEGLLVAQGNDMATLLADWDAGNEAAFVAKMNTAAHAIGLDSTKFTDPSGLDPGSVSTPSDMIRLGEAAMTIATFAQIVAMPQVTLPLAGLVYNSDYDLGSEGIVGIKTGSDASAGGCFLFEAHQTLAGKSVTIIGAVLGQRAVSPITAALFVGAVLVKTGYAAMAAFLVVRPSHPVGTIVAPWGASAPVAAVKSASIVGWPGLTVPIGFHVGKLPTVVPMGARIGVLRVRLDDQNITVGLRALRRLPGPSVIWRLTRL